MEFPETEIAEIKKFMDFLNSQTNCAVVVEGKRDAAALVKIGLFWQNFGIPQVQWNDKIC